ncbi:MAG: hypothetical protein KF778_20055 [Rhodocyclaceae bacterium]|nr:hypothetical protein [Rhodocyclaceae bacterium]MBX3670703.1 hypothetical protein [Rhodocyclaceae bacterium]
MRLILLLVVVALVGYLTVKQLGSTTPSTAPGSTQRAAPTDVKRVEQDVQRAVDDAAAQQRRKLDEATR